MPRKAAATMQDEEQVVQEAKVAAQQPVEPGSILAVIKDAVVNKADVETMRELLTIRREELADQARREFANALVQFRALVKPVIMTGYRDDTKTRKKDGTFGTVKYPYAELTTTIEQITPGLKQCGFTPTWQMVKSEPNWVELECILTHMSGHKESSLPLGAPPEGSSGQTAVQKRMGTITSLKRATLFMVLGLVTTEDDRHLSNAEQGEQEPPKSEAQRDIETGALEAKKRFVALCRQKAEDAQMSMDNVKRVYEAVADIVGDDPESCLSYLGREELLVAKDGTITVLTDNGEPEVPAEEMPPIEPPPARFVCGYCNQKFPVKPARGRCPGQDGKPCPGQVREIVPGKL